MDACIATSQCVADTTPIVNMRFSMRLWLQYSPQEHNTTWEMIWFVCFLVNNNFANFIVILSVYFSLLTKVTFSHKESKLLQTLFKLLFNINTDKEYVCFIHLSSLITLFSFVIIISD